MNTCEKLKVYGDPGKYQNPLSVVFSAKQCAPHFSVYKHTKNSSQGRTYCLYIQCYTFLILHFTGINTRLTLALHLFPSAYEPRIKYLHLRTLQFCQFSQHLLSSPHLLYISLC